MNKALFFKMYKELLDKDKKLTQEEVDNIDLFLDLVIKNRCYFTIPQWAYVFATTFHETFFTFKPVIEAFWLSEEWRKKNLRYYPWYGRGYVQETWYENYLKNEKRTGVLYTKNPNLALVPENAFNNMIYNLKHGIYTGKRLDYYINDKRKSYLYARYTVNGIDKRELIAGYAETFEQILIKTL
tara:strand:- start:1205 stop:1756 length:552 start_codon:yes stop_codon:yes gene_type:complete